MFTTSKRLVAAAITGALYLCASPGALSQSSTENTTEANSAWDVTNPPYKLNEVTINTNETTWSS